MGGGSSRGWGWRYNSSHNIGFLHFFVWRESIPRGSRKNSNPSLRFSKYLQGKHSHKRGNTLNFVKAVLGSLISLLPNHMGRNLQMKLVREEEQADMSSPLFQSSLNPRQPTMQMNLTLLTFLIYREWPLELNPEMQGIQSKSYREMGKAGLPWIQFTVQRHHII